MLALEEHEPELQLTAQNSRNLSELHDAYRTFCEYGWHHLTWKNLAYALTTYLSADFPQSLHGQLLHSQPDTLRSNYLANLDIESFGYLTKDVLWVLFLRVGFGSDYEMNLGYYRPFETPAWQYIALLPSNILQILVVDVANILRDRTTSSQARTNILSLASSWRPTFGAEYGIFQFLEVELSANDLIALHSVLLERSNALKPLSQSRPKAFLRRALSVRNIQYKKSGSPELGGEEFQQRKRFSWPLTERYKRLFPRRKADVARRGSQETTIKPKSTPGVDFTMQRPQEDFIDSTTARGPTPVASLSDNLTGVLIEDDASDAASTKSSDTLQSLLDFYSEGLSSEGSTRAESTRSVTLASEIARPDSPILAPISSIPINRHLSLRSAATRNRRSSSCSGHESFITANTQVVSESSSRPMSRMSGRTSPRSFQSLENMDCNGTGLLSSSTYYRLLKDHDLIPEPMVETDWSGRGQHAEYTLAERVHIPLQVEKPLGRTRTALVESVLCKRVRLVRKTVKCSRWTGVKREDAVREVQHLYRAQHAHIVRLVGTYVIGSDLAILTYPCAEWNLEQFMGFARSTKNHALVCASALRQFFTCSAKVMDFLHSFPIKHMDIKPQNLLVRDISTTALRDASCRYKLYFTDFGISRAYSSVDECDTESPTSFTRTYAAREVVYQETRGLSADMFSLGCVYAEMLATILDTSAVANGAFTEVSKTAWVALRNCRQNADNETRPYHCATQEVRSWLSLLALDEEPELLAMRDWIVALLSNEAHLRPTAHQIADDPRLPCACLSCNLRKGPEEFEAAGPLVGTSSLVIPHHWETPARASIEVPVLV